MPARMADGASGSTRSANRPAVPQLFDQRLQPFGRVDDGVVVADGVSGWRVLHHERAEAHAGEVREGALTRRAAVAQRLGIELHRHVDPDARQLPALPRIVGMLDQAFAVSLVGHLGGMGEQLFERAVARDELARALLADAGHPLDVVDRVAHQREHVDDLRRQYPELLFHALGVVPRAFVPGVVDRDAVVHQLKEVLVAGDDRHLEAGRHGLRRQRADHVVGLVALRGDDRHTERLAGLVHPRDLLGEIRRHRRAIGLVVGDQIVAERAPGQVERRADELRLMILNQLAQHVHEDVDGVRGLAARAAQAAAAHRVIRAVHLRTAVDQEDTG